jgi:molecular chaperone IbpA
MVNKNSVANYENTLKYIADSFSLPSASIFTDSWFKDLDPFFNKNQIEPTFPPYNMLKTGENEYEIHLAVAGFKKDEISVILSKNELKISGKKLKVTSNESLDDVKEPTFLHQGIAFREFKHNFKISQYTKVKDITLSDGILNISLTNIIPEDEKDQVLKIR